MPFRSESERRWLWVHRPDIARRWAHEYPKSNRGLPMYCHTKIKSGKNKGRICGRKKCRLHH